MIMRKTKGKKEAKFAGIAGELHWTSKSLVIGFYTIAMVIIYNVAKFCIHYLYSDLENSPLRVHYL